MVYKIDKARYIEETRNGIRKRQGRVYGSDKERYKEETKIKKGIRKRQRRV